MLHHIFRNLWNSRKRNVWILLELIVIAIVCWMVIDPLFVIFIISRFRMAMRQMGCTGFSFLWFLLMKKFARKISGN